MDQREILEIAKRYIDSVRANKIVFEKAYLFGSYSKGTFNDDSDIDIAFVIKNLKDRFSSQVNLLKLAYNIDTRIEPHPLDCNILNSGNAFGEEILKHGIEIL